MENKKTFRWMVVIFLGISFLLFMIVCCVAFYFRGAISTLVPSAFSSPTPTSTPTLPPTATPVPTLTVPPTSTSTLFSQGVLSNPRTAKDQDGINLETNFSFFDTVYVVSDIVNGAQDDVITSKWYAVNVDGIDPNFFLDQGDVEITEADAPFNGVIYFYFTAPTEGWPPGTYKVEVLFNGVLIDTVNFTIQ